MAIVGKKEIDKSTIALRERGKGDCGERNLEKFILELKQRIALRK